MKFLNTSLFEMSFFGAVLILAILAVRALFIHKLPKYTFVILWLVALLRLMLPFSIPSAPSVYPLIEKATSNILSDASPALSGSAVLHSPSAAPVNPSSYLALSEPGGQAVPNTVIPPQEDTIPIWFFIYCAGVVLCAAWMIFSYIRLRLEFRLSLPMGNEFTLRWLKDHPLRRTITLRQSDCTITPLTYGILHPVILMPKTVSLENEEELSYILLHEYTHILRFDAALKLAMAAALCIHWFNPFVYVMYFFFSRDIELACDEKVICQCGNEARASYALTLIGMEEKRLTLSPFYSGFGKNAIEERITAIMKTKKASLLALFTAALLIASATAIFAVSAKQDTEEESQNTPNTEKSFHPFTEEDKTQLLSLQIEGYKDMTVREFRNTLWEKRDTPEILKLCESFSSTLDGYKSMVERAAGDSSGFAEYFFFIYDPLTAKHWQSREFSGCSLSTPQSGAFEQASFEYTLLLTILDDDTLTVSEYDDTRREAMNYLDTILHLYSDDDLTDENAMLVSLSEKTAALEKRLCTEKLTLSVHYFFLPLSYNYEDDMLLQEIMSDISAKYGEVLSPYTPFGLTWEFFPDSNGGELKMYYQNREVRGIFDPKEQIWISAHSGITTYSEDAVELYTVYEDDVLSGLRFATEEEQREWSEIRWKNSNTLLNSDEENETP